MVSFQLFGFPLLMRDSAIVDISRRKVVGLLAYLAVTGERLGRDALAGLLFPMHHQRHSRANLSNTLSNLASAIGGGLLRLEGDAAWLPPDSSLKVDVREFRRLAAAAGHPGPEGSTEETRQALESADRLVRGAFLAGFGLKDSPGFDEWQREEQERLRLEHARVLDRLADIREARGELDEAITFAQKRLALDDFDEPNHRRLMRLHFQAGHRGEALAQFERCATALRRELGTEPEPETEELHQRILHGSPDRGGHAPRAAASPRGNLPAPIDPLIGRERELETVAGLLLRPDARLLTLVGPGGIGKTHLALQAAAASEDRFVHGTFFVELAQLRDPEAVIPAITSALRVQDTARRGRSPLDILRDALAGRHVLLVLDNFEHLLPAAESIAALLAACRDLRVLATSREPLHLLAEQVFPVPPLGLCDGSPGQMRNCAAVRLFEQRATAAVPGFVLDDRSAPVAAAICSRLDGLPLAIVLAAARTRSLSPRALLERLDHRLALLSNGPLDLPARQRTLRSEIDWSHELLDDAGQRLFRRLAVFAGGCTPESAAAVCIDRDEGQIPSALERLSELQDKSLLETRDCVDGPRFQMLQTIREYAMERMEARGETEAIHRRLACWCRELAETAEPRLYGSDQRRWLDRLEAEHANICSSLEWLHARGDVEEGLRLSGAMGWFWFRRARFIEGRKWLETFRGLARDGDPSGSLARVLYYLGWMRSVAGRNFIQDPEIMECLAECIDRCPPDGDGRYRASAMAWIGEARRRDGKEAADLAEGSIALARRTADPWTIAFCLVLANQYDSSHRRSVDRSTAECALEEAIALAQVTGDPFILCQTLRVKGEMLYAWRQWTEAESLFRESLGIARACGDLRSIVMAVFGLAEALHGTGRPLETKELYRDTLRMAMDAGTRGYLGVLFGGLSWVAIAEGRPVRAARLWGASMAVVVPAEGFPAQLPVDVGLEEGVGKAEWLHGHSMSTEEAAAYALSDE